MSYSVAIRSTSTGTSEPLCRVDLVLCSQDARRFQPATLSISNQQNTGCNVGAFARHYRVCARSQRVQVHKHKKLHKRLTRKLTVNQAITSEVDVAVIGGGIIGLCVAFQLLCHASKPSVALVERQVPCSGATGAGKSSILTEHQRFLLSGFSNSTFLPIKLKAQRRMCLCQA